MGPNLVLEGKLQLVAKSFDSNGIYTQPDSPEEAQCAGATFYSLL
jgi:hypothetical protein